MKKLYSFQKTNRLLSLLMMVVFMSSFFAASNAFGQDVSLLGSWSFGTTKAKEAGNKRLLVVTVTGETAVMNNLTDISLTYGGQPMNKIVSTSEGTTGFGNFSYIFTLDEAGIAAADETGTISPTYTTVTPTSGVDFFSAFYSNVDQTTPVVDTSFVHLNGTVLTAPSVNAALGEVVLMSVAFAGQPRTPSYTTGFNEILKNPESKSWGSGIIASKDGDGSEVIPSITNPNSERGALTAIVLKKAKNLVKTPVVLLDSWTVGTTKVKAAGTKRLLVVGVTGETAVMNNLTDISLTYGGQLMSKVVSTSEGTTGFGNFSYLFILNEAGIAAADESGTIVPTYTSVTPTSGVDIYSAFYDKVDQTTPVSDTSFIHLNGTVVTAPAVNAAFGDVVLMSVAFAGQPRTPSYTTGFTEILKNPNGQSWGSGIIAYKDGDGSEVIPSITNTNSERAALTAIVLMQGEEEGVPPTYYNLTVNTPTGGTIKIDPNRVKYTEGTVVSIKATPNFGFYFVNWTDSINASVPDTSIVMNSDKVITANFAEKTKYTLTTEVSDGSVYLNPAGGTYYEGVAVTLYAQPNVGFNFMGWDGDVSGTENPISVVMDSAISVKALMEKIEAYTLNVSGTNGTVSVSPVKTTYGPNEAVVLIAIPDEGYRFANWSGDLSGTENPTAIFMSSDKTITGNFEVIPPSYTLTTTAVNGTITLDPDGGTYDEGTVVTITATANDHFRFTEWSGDLTGSVNPTTITMNGDMNVTASFIDVTGISKNMNTPGKNSLEQNFPNPFSTVTTIAYQVNKLSNVNLTVYNCLGEKISILVDQQKTPGYYSVDWNGNDSNGKRLAKGIYFYRLEIDNQFVQFRKALLTE